MAGIYLHIPFCKKACYYCNFHFSTSSEVIHNMVQSIRKELAIRKDFLSGELTETIYFGGGTPSLLDNSDISNLLNDIYKYFTVSKNPEITLEANPDDLNETKIIELKALGINRLSIGVQSFNNPTLRYLNRSHDSNIALNSIRMAKASGFNNINIDLIFGIEPGYLPILTKDLIIVKSLAVEHLSTYCLTIEPGTVLYNWQKKGKIQVVNDDDAAKQYEYVIDELTGSGYDHYEISNFAIEGHESKHNSNYWFNEKYLGVGPSAHSYNLVNRYSNISNNSIYIRSLDKNIIPETIDYLTDQDRINEYIMTSIRTKWGCDLNYINSKFGVDIGTKNLSYIKELKKEGYIVESDNLIKLTKKGKLVADKIGSDMFIS